MSFKEEYREFCKEEKEIPIFSRDWWLDAVCGEPNWDVVLFKRNKNIVASMPFFVRERFGLRLISMPVLTPKMGPYIKYSGKETHYKKLSFEKKVMQKLIEQLPDFSSFEQNFDFKISNWLPFYWLGFSQQTFYTYKIELDNVDKLDNIYESDIRRQIKKSVREEVAITEKTSIGEFYELNKKTFARKRATIPYSLSFIENLYSILKDRNSVKILSAINKDKKLLASCFLVEDFESTYYLMGGMDPDFKQTGAVDFLLSTAIEETLKKGKRFDFEGSMIEPIEKKFRSFGAIQTPYLRISKTNSRLILFRKFLRDFFQ